jgi:hypothetical protein
MHPETSESEAPAGGSSISRGIDAGAGRRCAARELYRAACRVVVYAGKFAPCSAAPERRAGHRLLRQVVKKLFYRSFSEDFLNYTKHNF